MSYDQPRSAAAHDSTLGDTLQSTAPWLPMIVIALVQIQLSFNINVLVISMGEIVDEFDISATAVGTALVVYSLAVAGLVMLGAKFGKIIGSRLALQIGIAGQGIGMLAMALSFNAEIMSAAQLVAGIAAALAVPAMVVMITAHYSGKQQEQSLGLLGAAQASSSAAAFLIVGFLSLFVSWRWSFGLLVVLAAVNLYLTFRLKTIDQESGLKIDWLGAALAAGAVTLISLGFNSVNAYGLLVARPDAPFDFAGLSPSPILIIVGVVLGQAFFTWLRRQHAAKKPTLLALEVLDTEPERAATITLLVIGTIGPAINFLLPLYIQIVQGRSASQTAIAVVPYAIAIFIGTIFVVRVYDHLAPKYIGRYGFAMVAVGLFALAFAINNEWGTPAVIVSLLIIGLGEGALLTLVFNVLISASPKELSGDVGALRGTVNNLATGLGTAIASLLAVAALGILINTSVDKSPAIPPTLVDQFELDTVDFISNDELEVTLQEETTASAGQIDEAVRINTEARLRALKISFQILAGLALLGIIPAGKLPPYRRGEIPADSDAAESAAAVDALEPAASGA